MKIPNGGIKDLGVQINNNQNIKINIESIINKLKAIANRQNLIINRLDVSDSDLYKALKIKSIIEKAIIELSRI